MTFHYPPNKNRLVSYLRTTRQGVKCEDAVPATLRGDYSNRAWEYAFDNCPCAGESLETYAILDDPHSKVIGRAIRTACPLLGYLTGDIRWYESNAITSHYTPQAISDWLKPAAMYSQLSEIDEIVKVLLS